MIKIGDSHFEAVKRGGVNRSIVQDRSELIEIFQAVMRDETITHYTSPADELTAMDEALDGTENARERYRLQVGMARLPIQGSLGKLSVTQCEDMIRSQLHTLMKKGICGVQGGDWKVVAWELREQALPRKTRKKKAKVERWDRYAEDPFTAGHGVDQPMTTEFVDVKDFRLVLTVAVAEMSANDPVDALYMRTGRDDPGMKRFIETKNARYAPPPWRKAREKAIDLIEEFYAHRKAAKRTTAPESGAAEGPELSPAVLAMAAVLRGQGMKWGEIASMAGVPWQTLKKAMKEEPPAGDDSFTEAGL